MPAIIKIEFCTSCGSKNIEVTGQQYYCPDCDVTYKVTEAGTKVVSMNPLGKTNERLDQIEKDVAEIKCNKSSVPKEVDDITEQNPAESKPSDDESTDQDGFVNW